MKYKFEPPFVVHRISMLKSPAYGVASQPCRRLLDLLEIEHLSNGGKENGNLILTHVQMRQAGLHHDAIAPAIREAAALGLIAVKRGKAGIGNHRAANVYRLTYLPTHKAKPTDDWRHISTIQEARLVAAKARKTPARKLNHHTRLTGQSPHPPHGTINPETAEITTPASRDNYLDTSLPGREEPAARREAIFAAYRLLAIWSALVIARLGQTDA